MDNIFSSLELFGNPTKNYKQTVVGRLDLTGKQWQQAQTVKR
jgi:hypothetical protein